VVEDKLTSIGIGGRYMSATAELSQACDWASHVAVELGSHRHNMCFVSIKTYIKGRVPAHMITPFPKATYIQNPV
jgi:hypothetical protein